jgi:hypothetical protein
MTRLNVNNRFSRLPDSLFHRQASIGLDQAFLVHASANTASLMGLSSDD